MSHTTWSLLKLSQHRAASFHVCFLHLDTWTPNSKTAFFVWLFKFPNLLFLTGVWIGIFTAGFLELPFVKFRSFNSCFLLTFLCFRPCFLSLSSSPGNIFCSRLPGKYAKGNFFHVYTFENIFNTCISSLTLGAGTFF